MASGRGGRNVLAAACAVSEDAPGVQQLVGYVVPRDGRAVDPERLRALLRSRLPAYMVPALIETLADLPRLPSGKLDRASLPAPRARRAPPRARGARARTETERRIAEVWQALFRPQPVSIADDFFREIVVQLVIGAAQAADELADLRRRSVSERGMDELERCGPSFGPRGNIGDDIRLQVAPVRLVEQLGGLDGVEAQVVGPDLRDLTRRAQPGQRDRRRPAAGEYDRQALRCACDKLAYDEPHVR